MVSVLAREEVPPRLMKPHGPWPCLWRRNRSDPEPRCSLRIVSRCPRNLLVSCEVSFLGSIGPELQPPIEAWIAWKAVKSNLIRLLAGHADPYLTQS
jgi:hypothetical protein